MSNDTKYMGLKITYFRAVNGFTQEEFAEKTGISVQTLRNYEDGKTMPNIEFIAQLSKILSVSSDSVLNETLEDLKRGKANDLFLDSVHVNESEKQRITKVISEYKEKL